MRGPVRRVLLAIPVVLVVAALAHGGQQGAGPTLDEALARMSRYVGGYGEQASLIVAVETYQQSASTETLSLKPRKLTAEFAIVRVEGSVGWVGFRDVIEVEGKAVGDRADRLRNLFMAASFDPAAVTKVSNESARFNVGPTIRNFNVPTTTLFFFHPANVGRFSFTKKGTGRIGGVDAWEIGFVETRRPTLIMKRDGTDVPCEGTVWVSPADGTVLRTRLQLRHFADQRVAKSVRVATAPPPPPPPPPASYATAGSPPPPPPPPPAPLPSASSTSTEMVDLQSLADIDVTYERNAELGLWLPSKMTEVYEGPMSLTAGAAPSLGRTVNDARYSNFKRFQTSAKITFPK